LTPSVGGAAQVHYAKKHFEGALDVNDAPIEFDAKRSKGRYRRIPLFNVGDGTSGIPVECEGMPEERAISYGGVEITREQTIDETDGFVRIKAEFKSPTLLKGTIKVNGEGQGVFCTSNGPLDFKATLVP
jgi:hypothetical protein